MHIQLNSLILIHGRAHYSDTRKVKILHYNSYHDVVYMYIATRTQTLIAIYL